MATSKDFTMKDESSLTFNWIMDGSTREALEVTLQDGGTVESFVREYVRGTISGWLQTVDCKAKVETVYRMWRQSGEFAGIVSYVKGYFYHYMNS